MRAGVCIAIGIMAMGISTQTFANRSEPTASLYLHWKPLAAVRSMLGCPIATLPCAGLAGSQQTFAVLQSAALAAKTRLKYRLHRRHSRDQRIKFSEFPR